MYYFLKKSEMGTPIPVIPILQFSGDSYNAIA